MATLQVSVADVAALERAFYADDYDPVAEAESYTRVAAVQQAAMRQEVAMQTALQGVDSEATWQTMNARGPEVPVEPAVQAVTPQAIAATETPETAVEDFIDATPADNSIDAALAEVYAIHDRFDQQRDTAQWN